MCDVYIKHIGQLTFDNSEGLTNFFTAPRTAWNVG